MRKDGENRGGQSEKEAYACTCKEARHHGGCSGWSLSSVWPCAGWGEKKTGMGLPIRGVNGMRYEKRQLEVERAGSQVFEQDCDALDKLVVDCVIQVQLVSLLASSLKIFASSFRVCLFRNSNSDRIIT